MTVVGLDDTDSREGMCSTYVAARVAERLRERGAAVDRQLLVRLNPAVEHKTRGNAALAVHTDADPDLALSVASEAVTEFAEVDTANTNPGVVVADHPPAATPREVVEWACEAVRDHHDREDALELVDAMGYGHAGWGNARGTVGALAAVGAWAAFEEWTYELISYRERDRWGTPREVDRDSVFAAAETAYPEAWDTVDSETGDAVCVPNTPGPVLYGIRGDDPGAVRGVSDAVESEPADGRALFVTNQGTDAHLRNAHLAEVRDGQAYRIDGVVAEAPAFRKGGGGHVRFTLRDGDATLPCVAFEPTKRFRDHVRRLRVGDRITACGEVADGTLKLEKFAVRSLVGTERVVPTCPGCGRSMESAGRGQGYRCRDCGTATAGKAEQPVARDLEPGWYEVPPGARRHVAKPLVRGGFDAPVHPER
ncbi:tRNA(Ile2) 2-agmatinylcytidine synthetase [Halobacteriales archaeon QS_1_68_20]|nr:MAG: tRNA(Ile2) 2-agmatinylcytidine synthetase [Halobacteriales archaeon QS_1_68_20]